MWGNNSEGTKRERGKYGKVRYGEKTGKIFIEILTGAAQRQQLVQSQDWIHHKMV